MVSLWPWKGSDNSPASFEKTLSTLSTQIARNNTYLYGHQRQSRRFQALWTLYSIFIYLLYVVILILVVGWKQWGPVEYTVVAGGPVVIYAIRAIGNSWYHYHISRTQDTLDALQKERDKTIEKLKEATQYNSTLKLLEKYGQESPRLPFTPEEGRPHGGHTDDQKGRQNTPIQTPQTTIQGPRTGLAPPSTANIQWNLPVSHPSTPQTPPPAPRPQTSQGFESLGAPATPPPPQLGFHPSAFPPQQQYNQPHSPQWYDRILDVLLGEDETLPQNRLALICQQCRLVNGQAAPGVKTLEDVGRWRCGGCGAWNGVEDGEGNHGSLRPHLHGRTRSKSMPHPTQQPEIQVSGVDDAQDATHHDDMSSPQANVALEEDSATPSPRSDDNGSEQASNSDAHAHAGNGPDDQL